MSDKNQEETPQEPVVIHKKKSFVVPALAAAVLLGGGFFAGKTFTSTSPELPAPVEVLKEATKADAVSGHIVDLGPQFVNLSDGRYLKISVSMMYDPEELPSKDDAKSDKDKSSATQAGLPLNLAPARDTVIEVFSGLTAADLSVGDGRNQARSTLLEALQTTYKEDLVIALYFSEFVWE